MGLTLEPRFTNAKTSIDKDIKDGFTIYTIFKCCSSCGKYNPDYRERCFNCNNIFLRKATQDEHDYMIFRNDEAVKISKQKKK